MDDLYYFVGNRAKGWVSKRMFQERKHAKFSEKRTFLTPWYSHVYVWVSGGKKCSLFGKFGALSFLETPVLRFALLPYYRWSLLFLIVSVHTFQSKKLQTCNWFLINYSMLVNKIGFRTQSLKPCELFTQNIVNDHIC